MAQHPRPEEQPAVKTTIVGGRPPGAGKPVGQVPRGIEVLTKKAAVDAEFCALLLEKRGAAADAIGLGLSATERAMLSVVPEKQLRGMIANTRVPQEQRGALLAKSAAVILAALGMAQVAGCGPDEGSSAGIAPDRPARGGATTQAVTRPAPEAAGDEEKAAQEPRIGFVGGIVVLTTTKAATAPTEPAEEPREVAGAKADRPARVEVADGVRPDRPDADQQEPVTVFGAMVKRSREEIRSGGGGAATTGSAPGPDRPPVTVLGIQPATQGAEERMPSAGARATSPATTQGTTTGASGEEPVPPVLRIAGVMAEPRGTRGIQPDRPTTSTQPTTEPTPVPPPAPTGSRPDRPEVQKGVRADRP